MATTRVGEAIEEIRTVRQARLFTETPVTEEQLQTILEVARWTGSARNTQPWHFIVIRDRDALQRLSSYRPNIAWLANVPVAIAIVLDGRDAVMEAYDEGRVTERMLIAAKLMGLGGGVAWFGEEGGEADAKQLLGVPEGLVLRAAVAIGEPQTTKDHRPMKNTPGRKLMTEIVSRERFGQE
jgi:nitroreductase